MLRWYRDLLAGDTDILGIAAWSFWTLAMIAGYVVSKHPAAPLAWTAFILVLVPGLATVIPYATRTFRSPDRLPINWGDRLWLTIVILVGGALLGGLWDIAAGDYLLGATLLLLGAFGLGLVIRHVRKPIRLPEPPQPNLGGPGGWDEPPPRGWRMFR